MILLVLIYLMSSLVIVLSHELLHFFMAKIKEKHYSSQDNQKLNRFLKNILIKHHCLYLLWCQSIRKDKLKHMLELLVTMMLKKQG